MSGLHAASTGLHVVRSRGAESESEYPRVGGFDSESESESKSGLGIGRSRRR